MKCLVSLFVLLSFSSSAQPAGYLVDPPKVDHRVELLSIVFRLAEAEEYSGTSFKMYTDRIERHFRPYQDHELIQLVKKIRNDHGVGYDAVMSMAICIDTQLNPLVPFTDEQPDKRWAKKNAEAFGKQLKQFYKDAACEAFFEQNKDLYAEVSQRFLPVYEKLDLKWYSSFYGKAPSEKFIIVNGVGNGGGNFGPSITYADQHRDVYAIMGTWSVDDKGMALFDVRNYFPTLLHEFNHSFVNALLPAVKNELKASGEKLYAAVKEEMKRQAYGNWETILNEALVRAAVIKYMKDHNFDREEIANEVSQQMDRGFVWINELVAELEKYDQQRHSYTTLQAYMPRLAAAYKEYAGNIENYRKEYERKKPKVIAIAEFENGSKKVSASIKTITVKFDRPLLGKGKSISLGKKGRDAVPNFGEITYSEDRQSVIIEVDLVSNKEYEFVLTGRAFKSVEWMPMNDYTISFETLP